MTSKPDLEFVVRKLMKDDLQTIEYYFGRDSLYAEWRENLHDEVIEEILNNDSYKRNNHVYILGGAPANGKSSFLKSKHCPYPKEALKIDPDEIKKLLPEYNMMVELDYINAANAVHEESSVISKDVRARAMESGIDIILDGVADNTLEARTLIFNEFKEKGYYVRMDYVSLETDRSLELAELREQETGRHVPPEFIKSMNVEISRLVPKIIENNLADELYLWDTNQKDKPVLVLSLKNRNLVIHEKNLYDNFLKKGHGEN